MSWGKTLISYAKNETQRTLLTKAAATATATFSVYFLPLNVSLAVSVALLLLFCCNNSF